MTAGQRAGVVQEYFPKLMDKLLLWDGFMHPEMFPFFSAQQTITKAVHHQSPCFVCAISHNSG